MSDADLLLIEDLDRAIANLRHAPPGEKPECGANHAPIRDGLVVLLRIEKQRMTTVRAEGASKGIVTTIATGVATVIVLLAKVCEVAYNAGAKP